MQPKVAVFGILRFPPDRMDEVRPHLKVLIQTTYQNDNCLAYDVAEDPFEPGLLRFSELWPDHASLTRHLEAPHLRPWRQAARASGLLERKFTAFDIGASREI